MADRPEAKGFLDELPTRKLGVIVVREKFTRTDYGHTRIAHLEKPICRNKPREGHALA
jgi:hypothetical protein